MVWDPIFKRFSLFDTTIRIEIVFLIDLAIGQAPSTLANTLEPQPSYFQGFRNVAIERRSL